jgi:hypothetical protein
VAEAVARAVRQFDQCVEVRKRSRALWPCK